MVRCWSFSKQAYFDVLVQEWRNASALAMELRLFRTNTSICTHIISESKSFVILSSCKLSQDMVSWISTYIIKMCVFILFQMIIGLNVYKVHFKVLHFIISGT